ncbi:MAG: GTP pyrophosphokinase family protein [Lachnospiraceae bacterium]|nr:GTP pyrophosphokinase family protein [Lachnospiraceae bacterium]
MAAVFALSPEEQQEWNRQVFLFSSAIKKINTKIDILKEEFISVQNYNPIEHVTSRLKTEKSIARKLEREGHEVNLQNIDTYLNDIAGVRIVCSFTSDIYKIADLISEQDDIKVLIVKNYIANPKSNGYKSYHMIVTIPIYLSDGKEDVRVEIQIRTIAMDFWASLEHKIYYKFEGNAPDYIKEELAECARLTNTLDERMLSLNEEIRKFSGKEDE